MRSGGEKSRPLPLNPFWRRHSWLPPPPVSSRMRGPIFLSHPHLILSEAHQHTCHLSRAQRPTHFILNDAKRRRKISSLPLNPFWRRHSWLPPPPVSSRMRGPIFLSHLHLILSEAHQHTCHLSRAQRPTHFILNDAKRRRKISPLPLNPFWRRHSWLPPPPVSSRMRGPIFLSHPHLLLSEAPPHVILRACEEIPLKRQFESVSKAKVSPKLGVLRINSQALSVAEESRRPAHAPPHWPPTALIVHNRRKSPRRRHAQPTRQRDQPLPPPTRQQPR